MKSETSTAPPNKPPFPHYASKYTVSGGIHVMNGSLVLAILLYILSCFSLRNAFFSRKSDILTTFNRIVIGPEIFCLLLLTSGLRSRKSVLLVPYILCLTAKFVFHLVIFGFCVYSHHHPDTSIAEMMKEAFDLKNDGDDKFITGSNFAIFLLGICSFCLITFLDCFKYLSDIEEYKRKNSLPKTANQAPFPHNDRRYTLCSGLHVMRASAYFSVLLMISYLCDLRELIFTSKSDQLTIINRIAIGPLILCLALLMFGLYNGRPGKMFPYISAVALKLVYWFVILCICVYSHHRPDSAIAIMMQGSLDLKDGGDDKFIKAIYSILCVMTIYLLSFVTFCGCDRYLTDLKLYNMGIYFVSNV